VTEMTRRAYIFDLDGTLANIEHRLHHIRNDTGNGNHASGDWDAFNDAIPHDIPNWDLINVMQCLNMEFHVIVVTGRMYSDKVYADTVQWLAKHSAGYDAIYFRPNGDYRSDYIVKKEIYENFIKEEYDVLAVFDDRQTVVDMWRSLGLRCYQVQPGDF